MVGAVVVRVVVGAGDDTDEADAVERTGGLQDGGPRPTVTQRDLAPELVARPTGQCTVEGRVDAAFGKKDTLRSRSEQELRRDGAVGGGTRK